MIRFVGSPLSWATLKAAPAHIVHGTKDDHVAYKQAPWMRDRLKACMIEVELLTREGAAAGKSEAAMLAFLDKHLK